MGADAVLLIVAALDDARAGGAVRARLDELAWPPWSRCTTRTSSSGRSASGRALSASTSATCALSRWTGHTRRVWHDMSRRRDEDRRVGHGVGGRRGSLAEAGYEGVLVGEALVRRRRPASGRGRALGADRAMWVKICGVTSEEDALIAVAMGADAVGFIFAPSPRQMSPSAVSAITRRLPPEICTVGVFRDEEPRQRVVEIVNRSGLDAAQLHGNETFEDCGYVSVRVPLVIKAFPAGDARLAAPASTVPTSCWLTPRRRDRARSSTGGLPRAWPKGAGWCSPGASTRTTWPTPSAAVHPWGVDVSSGVESSVGKKDARRVRAFVQAARAAEPEPYDSDDAVPMTGRRTVEHRRRTDAPTRSDRVASASSAGDSSLRPSYRPVRSSRPASRPRGRTRPSEAVWTTSWSITGAVPPRSPSAGD